MKNRRTDFLIVYETRYSPMDSPGGSDSKNPDCKAGDLGSIPSLGGSRGEEIGYVPQYYFLENSSYTSQSIRDITQSH